ncbi:PREDICTED: protein PHLOEM PROTEIN 2-LIKE A5 [Camelina sativa]|uniref:Protein PHLOEM PROTEIN 2-LIKE A5 n=1 Tax=Camelina sativa TaxID=90675 RepID=A0ABM1RPW9_CAMSA|nr:PREDICTED: protein PHLOEM PROTEIN 2-LIKE A5 [Camelina sativa]
MKIMSLPDVHQVFLSFRGDQLRYSFVSHLLDAFERHEILYFVDKDELRGKSMTTLFVRIKESKIALVIFSSRYAESSWCMDELVKIRKRVDKGKLQVIPIFYKVRAIDVRGQTGEFGDKFWALAKTSRGVQIMEWKEALECVSNKMGLSLGDKSSEADFIKEIVRELERVLDEIRHKATEDYHCIN